MPGTRAPRRGRVGIIRGIVGNIEGSPVNLGAGVL
jgi:hypothetical protein